MTNSTKNSPGTPLATFLQSLDLHFGRVFGIKPSEFAVSLHRANQLTRFAGDEGAMLSPNQAQEFRVMTSVDPAAA